MAEELKRQTERFNRWHEDKFNYVDHREEECANRWESWCAALRAQLPSQQPKLGLADGDRPGYHALWLWFGMSRSSYAVLPRVMMHDMPDAWQADFARLMDQWDETWVNQPAIGTRVRVVDEDGQLIKTPNWMLNYRHPDREQLDSMRKKP